MCWVASKPSTGEMFPTVFGFFDLLRSFTFVNGACFREIKCPGIERFVKKCPFEKEKKKLFKSNF